MSAASIATTAPDGDRHFFASPEVAFLEKDVRDVMVDRLDHQPLNPTDMAVGCIDELVPAHRHLPQRHGVLRHRRRDVARAQSVENGGGEGAMNSSQTATG